MNATSIPQRQTDRKREAILHAAVMEFRSNGYDATSMDKIAATAEVSKRTVYNHFPSKEDLFAAILLQLWEKSAEQGDLLYQPDRPIHLQLQEILQRKMRLMCDTNFIDLVRVAVAATIHSPERACDMVAKLNNREDGVVAWIKAAQRDAKLKEGDPLLMADMLQGQLKAMAFWPQVTMGRAPLSEAQQKKLLKLTAEMFLLYHSAQQD